MTEIDKKIKVRFAPSPTGFLHVGGLRTALYNYLFAKQNNGQFILRIEDTDKERYVEEAEDNIKETLKSFGLNWEGEVYRQSENLEKYQNYAKQLIEQGHAYYDFTTSEELNEMRQRAEERGQAFRFRKELLHIDEGEIKSKIESGVPYVVRFEMPKNGSTQFSDIIRAQVSIENKELDDIILIKSDGYPTYNFANVIDDHEMGITHVIRGEEFVSSTPKHILLYQALGWEAPQFAHLPLLLNKNRAKLSKREGDVAVRDFLQKGYLKEALLNFVALLGWRPSESEKEIFSLEELIKEFELSRVQKGGAVFDLDKLNWFQKEWARKLSGEAGNLSQHPLYLKIKTIFEDEFKEIKEDKLQLLWPHIMERIGEPEKLKDDLLNEFRLFFVEPKYDAGILIWKKADKQITMNVLQSMKTFLQNLPDDKWSARDLEEEIKNWIQSSDFDTGTVLWPLRVALTGKEQSMPPFDVLEILNKAGEREIVFQRIDKAIEKLTND